MSYANPEDKAAAPAKPKAPISLTTLAKRKANGETFSCLTCYDANFAHAMQLAEIDTILVGDSLGMVVQGHTSTLPVTVEDMVYHTRAVARANTHALIMTDLPFMSYATTADAVSSARAVMQAGANVVKIEGGRELAETVTLFAKNGVPTCVHLGLTPQSVNVFGGYKIQAKTESAADKLMEDVRILVEAGAAIVLLECVPASLGEAVTVACPVPVIGIGAGICDGQVLVMHDMLGVHTRKPARFVKDFLTAPENQTHDVVGAFRAFHAEVRARTFPTPAHSF